MPKTVSFHNGTSWSRGHNVRDDRFIKEQNHIDKSLSGNNVVLKDEVVRKAYDRIFGEAVREYNAAQKRADRRIENYYNKIKESKKKHIVYECIVQIGDKDDTGNNALPEKEALKCFADTWEQRNPNLKLIGAYIHGDEPNGTVHMHIDYIPVAECARGMKLQNSLDKALQQQGFFTKNIKQTAQMAWQERERKALVNICKDLNIDVFQNTQGITKGRGHYGKAEYQREKDRAKQQIERELLPYQSLVDYFLQVDSEKKIDGVPLPTAIKMLIGKENRDKQLCSSVEIDELRQLAKATAIVSAKNEHDKEDLYKLYVDLSELETQAEKKLAFADRQKKQAEQRLLQADQIKREADEYAAQMQKFYSDSSPYIEQLNEQISKLKANIEWLSQDRKEQMDHIAEQSRQIDSLKDRISEQQLIKQQNGKLSERILALEDELNEKESTVKQKDGEIMELKED
ncbi:MAG: plasmid recombination protein [Oscillospiraceae bacterium]|nr:plasmid recombination protein [Oscillospiraceae bacterium]